MAPWLNADASGSFPSPEVLEKWNVQLLFGSAEGHYSHAAMSGQRGSGSLLGQKDASEVHLKMPFTNETQRCADGRRDCGKCRGLNCSGDE